MKTPFRILLPVLAASGIAGFLAQRDSPRLTAFDENVTLLREASVEIASGFDLRESWTREEVQAGHERLAEHTAEFAERVRALLEDAEKELGNTPREPRSGDSTVRRSGPPLDYKQHPDIPFAPLTEDQTAGFELGAFANGDDYRVGLADIVGYESAEIVRAEDYGLSGRQVIWNNRAPSWNKRIKGPLWGWRAYNVTGTIDGLIQYRVGDWTNGKEGHGLYLNPYRDLTLTNVEVHQSGAQAFQFPWRPAETRIPPSKWDNPEHTIRIIDCGAYDCGAITEGDAVRASWPLAYYAPGQSLELVRFTVRTRLPKFATSAGLRQSHGAVFIGPGAQKPVKYSGPDAYDYAGDSVHWTGEYEDASETFNAYTRTPSAILDSLDVEVWRSDREEVRLWFVSHAVLISPRIVDHGGSNDVVIVDDCGRVEIIDTRTRLVVHVKSRKKPYGPSLSTHVVEVGESWVWESE